MKQTNAEFEKRYETDHDQWEKENNALAHKLEEQIAAKKKLQKDLDAKTKAALDEHAKIIANHEREIRKANDELQALAEAAASRNAETDKTRSTIKSKLKML